MKNRCLLFALLLFCCSAVKAQLQISQIDSFRIPVLQAHYSQEYTFDRPVDEARWTRVEKGLHVSFGSSDTAYLRSEAPSFSQPVLNWNGTGWRGERMNAMIVAWSSDTTEQVRFELSDLQAANGKKISKKNIKLDMVRYVLSNYAYGTPDATCDARKDKAYLLPDRLESFEQFDIPGRSVRPVWLSINIPEETAAGEYRGTIRVRSEKDSATLNVQLKVQSMVLPKPKDWVHRLDLWQNPWVIAWYYQVEPWSDEHKMLLRKHLKLYADAGGKYITTYAVHSPWSDNSYMIEGTMIDWVKKKDGNWKFDYRIFDEYVQLAIETGIDKAITIYTPVPWGFRFRYMDEKTGNYIYPSWSPTSPEFKSFWDVFLTDLKSHLQKKGWFEKTYLGINENPMEHTRAAIKVIREHSPQWKITYAGDWHQELDTLLNDYSFLYGKEPNQKQVKERSDRGFTSTYYVCCNPPKPNNFTFSPPIEGRWISWYTAAYGYDGFLRWAYDAWPADPVRDSRHELWPAGDCFLVYPGANSSIRYEKLREGIADFEKIQILRKLAAKSNNANVKATMAKFNEFLQSFTTEKEFDENKLKAAVHKGNEMIGQLTEQLSKKAF